MSRFHREDRGQAIVLIAIVATALVLGVGAAIDAGQLYIARRAAQNAADSAAWAGAVVRLANGTAAAAQTAATDAATLNGYSTGVTAVSPPTSGVVSGDSQFIEVNITESVRTFFFPTRTLTVRAVAGAARSGSGEAVLVLRSDATANTLDLQNTSFLTTTVSGVHVNSSSANAVRIANAAGVQLTSVYTRVVGGVVNGDEAQISGTLVEGAPTLALADPYLNLPTPPTAGLPGPLAAVDLNNAPAGTVINPGIYNGQIRIRGTSQVTMNPGIYIIRRAGAPNNGGFLVENTATVTSAAGGVLIFLTHANYPAAPPGTPTCNPFDVAVTAGGNVNLSPRTTGAYAGLLVYQDRTCTTASASSQARNAGAKTLSGTIYLPSSIYIVTGGVIYTWNAQLIVRQLQLTTNNTRLNLNFVPAAVRGNRVPALVE